MQATSIKHDMYVTPISGYTAFGHTYSSFHEALVT